MSRTGPGHDTVKHGFTGVIVFIKRYIRNKVSHYINDNNKNSILPPNNVAPQKQLRLLQSGCRAT